MGENNRYLFPCKRNLHLPALNRFIDSDLLSDIEYKLEELRDEAFQYHEDDLISAGYRERMKRLWNQWFDEFMNNHPVVFAFTVYMKYVTSENVSTPEDSFTHEVINERISLLEHIVNSIHVILYVSIRENRVEYDDRIKRQMLGHHEEFLGDFIDTYFETQSIFTL